MKQEHSTTALPNMWDQSALRPYLGEVKRRHGVVETLALPNMRDLPPIRIEKLFVQPLLSKVSVDPGSPQESWPEGESLLDALSRERAIVLLGDPGSGKTTLANWLAWRLSSGLTAPLPDGLEGKLPVPCVLREMPAGAFGNGVRICDLAERVAERLLGENVSEQTRAAIRLRVDAGQYVLILDGIDEISVAHRPKVSEWIQTAVVDEACVVGTARLVGYDDYPVDRWPSSLQKEGATGISAAGNGDDRVRDLDIDDVRLEIPAWAAIRYLMPFDHKRISSFVENWYLQRSGSDQEARTRAEDLMNALAKSEQMQELARTPNLLSLMAIVHRERANLPDGKALLYKEISNAYINTIDQHRKILTGDNIARFSWEIKESWIAYVAFRMQLLRTQEEESVAEAGLLANESDVVAWLAEAMERSQVASPSSTAREFLEWVARRCGLLIPRGEGEYAFVHLSFQEYFCARYLAGRVMSRPFIKDTLGSDAPVTRPRLREWAMRSEWLESFVFLFEIISAENDIEWTEDLAEMVFASPDTAPAFGGEERSALAARVLTDRHIHLGAACRDVVASGCMKDVYEDWRYFFGQSEDQLFKLFSETEFATVYGDESATELVERGIVPKPFSVMQTIEKLRDLYMLVGAGMSVADISAVRHAGKLRYVSLVQTAVSDISPLASARDLRIVELDGSPVSDISALGNCAGLEKVRLRSTLVSDISALAKLKRLRTLDLNGTRVRDLTPVDNMHQLSTLWAARTSVSSISALTGLPGLVNLWLDGTAVSDLSPLRSNTALDFLSIDDTPVDDISPICSLGSLHYLSLSGTKIKNLNLIAQLPKLMTLRIGGPFIEDISFLAKLKGLRVISLWGPKIRDISVLAGLKDLRTIELIGTNVADLSPLLVLERLVEIKLNGKSIKNLSRFIESGA